MSKNDFSFFNTANYKLALCLSTTIFFYLFLIFFLPFGIDNYNPNHEYTFDFLFEIFKFASALFIVFLFNEFAMHTLIVKTTSLKNIVIWSIWTLLLLSTVTFYIYNFLGDWHDYLFISYLGFLVNVSSVLIFPLIGTFFFFRYRFLQTQIEHILTTKEGSIDADQLISFKGQGSRDEITLSVSNFLYGRAQDNYVELYYVEQNNIKKFLIRSSFRKLINSIDALTIKRCHRSYMVNLLHVNAIKGVSQEMILNLAPFDSSIPVSKSYRQAVLDNLHQIKNFK